MNLNQLEPKYSSNAISVLREAILVGAGISCLPDCAIQNQLKTGELIRIHPELRVEPGRQIFAVYPGRKNLSPITTLLVQYLKRKFKGVSERAGLL